MKKFLKQLFCLHEYEKMFFWRSKLLNRIYKTESNIESAVCFKCSKCGKLKYFYHRLVKENEKLEFKEEVRNILENRVQDED